MSSGTYTLYLHTDDDTRTLVRTVTIAAVNDGDAWDQGLTHMTGTGLVGKLRDPHGQVVIRIEEMW